MRHSTAVTTLALVLLAFGFLACGDSPSEPSEPMATALELSASRDTGLTGEQVIITARLTDQDGLPFTPTTAVSFAAGGSGEASLEQTSDTQTTATLTAAGTVTITASYVGLTARQDLTVTARAATSLVVEPINLTIREGREGTIQITGARDQGWADIDLPAGEVVWTSSDSTVATVSAADGHGASVYAAGAGTSTITARIDEVVGTARVEVTVPRAYLLTDTMTLELREARDMPKMLMGEDTVRISRARLMENGPPAVIDPDSLSDRWRIVARDTGVARIEVSRLISFEGQQEDRAYDTLTVTVIEWTAATITGIEGLEGAVGTGDALTLTGLGLNHLPDDAVRFEGQALTLLERTDTTFSVSAPPTVSDAPCGPPAPRGELEIRGGEVVATIPTLLRKREGELALAPGDTITFEGTGTDCLMLEAGPDREYRFVWFDMSDIENSKTTRTNPFDMPPYGAVLAEATAAASLSAPLSTPLSAPLSAPASEAAPTTESKTCETRPAHLRDITFYVGKTIETWPDCEPATVRAIVDDYVAVTVHDTATFSNEELANTVAQWQEVLAQEHLFQTAFGMSERPASNSAGQLYVLIRAGCPVIDDFAACYRGWASGQIWDGEFRGKIGHNRWGGLQAETASPGRSTFVLAHEWAHLVHWSHTRGGGHPNWVSEGVADLLAYQVLRAHFGYDFLTQIEGAPRSYRHGFHFQTQRFPEGYATVQSFFRNQMQRLMIEAGLSYESALAAVARGGGVGWHDLSREGTLWPGLISRMQTHLPGWTPEDALLTWLFSYSATQSGVHPTLRDMSFYDSSIHRAFADETLTAGPGGIYDAIQLRQFNYLSGYIVRIFDNGHGTGWRFETTVPVRWGIMRVR